MTPEEYRKWRPKYGAYHTVYPSDKLSTLNNKRITQFLSLTGLANEAAEAMAVMHKAFRKDEVAKYDKIKDELSDVWWYFNMCLDEFNLTLEELSDYNKKKLDERNK